jgi:hypothetical protein
MRRILESELTARRALVEATPILSALAARLERHLGSLAHGAVYVPEQKALLSRDGGVCPDDGSRLLFDPDRPFRHRCGRCGREVEGERHHRAWITRYQVWLSERAVHLALLAALRDSSLAARAAEVLGAYARRYASYPNEDNVLGPSRPFFSTYLESIWLVQVSLALALLEAANPDTLGTEDREDIRRMIAASAALVASFDEGWSNRQVWNGAALAAAGSVLADRDLEAYGRDTLRRLLGAVDRDGMWFEGENYHLFALRGFLLGAEWARWSGEDLYGGSRLGAMYAAPLATLLPDLTLPARGDAPFGVSIAQPRFAELWEIGRARTHDPALDAVLSSLYAAPLPDGDDLGRTELAEQEQNRAACRQRRDRLGWKGLLWMRPDAPRARPADAGRAILRERQGIVVLRSEPATVASLECGGRAGGHGHPDALHLSLARGRPLLADFGTASYVSPSLHWYRSTLAHNAPGVTGRGQAPVAGVCDGVGEQAEWAWCRVHAAGLLGPGTEVSRMLLHGPEWLLDVVTVDAPPELSVDLPLHPLCGVPNLEPGDPTTDAFEVEGHESGYDFLDDVRHVRLPRTLSLTTDPPARVQLTPRPGEAIFVATALGPPGDDFGDGTPLRFLVRRARGAGRWVQLVTWGAGTFDVRLRGPALAVESPAGATWIDETEDGIVVRSPRTAPVSFAARRRPPAPASPPSHAGPVPACEVPLWPDAAEPFAAALRAASWALGAESYRQSEQPYEARGGIRATVDIGAQGDAVWVRVQVVKPLVLVRDAHAPDPRLDNEPPAIHSDGVQAYVGRDRWMGVLVLPDFGTGGGRVSPVAGTAAFPGPVSVRSRRTADGYEMVLRLGTGRAWRRGDRLRLALTVNEMVPGRERRAGQLTLTGGGWVWLRGDRESPHEAVEAEIA